MYSPQVALEVKDSPANVGDVREAGLIPRSGRSPREGNGNRIPRTEEPGGLQSMGSQRIGHNWSDWAHSLIYIWFLYMWFFYGQNLHYNYFFPKLIPIFIL